MKQNRTVIFLMLLFLFASCANHNKEAINGDSGYAVSTQAYNKLVVMRYMEALSTSVFPEVAAGILAPDYHEIRKEFANMHYHATGSELAKMADPINVAIANRRDSTDVYIADKDTVVVRYTIAGTHAGNFYGIPATNNSFEISAAAIFWLVDGKITKSWSMADEAGLLRAIGKSLPARDDGRWEAAPYTLPARTGDHIMEEALANPVDSQEYRNKLQLNAWKSPAYKEQVLNPDLSQRTGLRSGFLHLLNAGSQPGIKDYPFSGAFPDRVDMITHLAADGKRAVVQFRLTAINSQSLFGIPAKDRPVAAYEFGFQEFDGEVWKTTWWFGDDLGMLLQIGGSQDYWFLGENSSE